MLLYHFINKIDNIKKFQIMLNFFNQDKVNELENKINKLEKENECKINELKNKINKLVKTKIGDFHEHMSDIWSELNECQKDIKKLQESSKTTFSGEKKEEKIKYVLKFLVKIYQGGRSNQFDMLKALINNTTDKDYTMNKLNFYLTTRKWEKHDLSNLQRLLLSDEKLANLLYNSRKSMVVL